MSAPERCPNCGSKVDRRGTLVANLLRTWRTAGTESGEVIKYNCGTTNTTGLSLQCQLIRTQFELNAAKRLLVQMSTPGQDIEQQLMDEAKRVQDEAHAAAEVTTCDG